MSTDRPYRTVKPYEQCVTEIAACSGTQLDQEWAEVFLELAGTGSF